MREVFLTAETKLKGSGMKLGEDMNNQFHTHYFMSNVQIINLKFTFFTSFATKYLISTKTGS